MHYVFSYGTLTSRFKLAPHNLMDGRLDAYFEMNSYGPYPALVRSDQYNSFVGTVMRFDDQQLDEADWYEGYPDLYTREKHPVKLDSGEEIQAWVYFMRMSINADR